MIRKMSFINSANLFPNAVRFKVSLLFITLFYMASTANSTVTKVVSIVALQSAINAAQSGDTIQLANGTYLNNSISVSKSNITIKPETIGSVFLNGTNTIVLSGNYIVFNGFQFTNGTASGSAITATGNHNHMTNLNFNGYGGVHMINIYGQYDTVSYSNFQNKPVTSFVAGGGTSDMVQVTPNADPSTPGYNVIRYCSFQHMPGLGGDFGNECIRLGQSTYSDYISRTLIEYCYFEDTGLGDSEAISVKCKENCIRNNTMRNNPLAMFVFRNGDDNVAYGNFFLRSGGIRVKQSNNIYIYNNYFENCSTNAPIYFEYYGAGFGDNFNVINNTFYRGRASIINSQLTNCTWANNIFYSDTATLFSGTNSGQTFTNNIYSGSKGLTINTGMTSANPLLTYNANGFYMLSASSPAIDASSASYPTILDITGIDDDPSISKDIQGFSRPATVTLKDLGCNEFTSGTVSNRPLYLSDVGPSYLTSATSFNCDACH